jgi:hypothetical protein
MEFDVKVSAKQVEIHEWFTGFCLAGFLSLLWGYWPGTINNLAAYYGTSSLAQCVSNQSIFDVLVCHRFGIPVGSYIVNGLPYLFCIGLLEKVGLSESVALSLISNFWLWLAFGGCVFLFRRVSVAILPALVLSFVFLEQPFFVYQSGYSTTMIAIAFLPAALWLDIKVYYDVADAASRSRWWLGILVYCLLRVLFLFLDGYAFVMSCLLSTAILAVTVAARNISGRSKLKSTVVFVVSNCIAVLLYRHLIPNNGLYQIEDADFFRGQGVDLISLVYPSFNYWVFKFAGRTYDSVAFYGDGSNCLFNFSGVVAPILACIFILTRKKSTGLLRGLACVGAIGFLLSLGPSLKINSQRPDAAGLSLADLGRDAYEMPPSKAVLNFGSDLLYTRLPALKNMRAVYRWIVIPKFILLIFAGLTLSLIARSQPTLLFALLLLVAVEQLPQVSHLFETYKLNSREFAEFKQDVLVPLKALLEPRKKIFYVSKGYDYIADYLTINVDGFSFNAAGDKAIAIAETSWPKAILAYRKSVDSYDKDQNIVTVLADSTVDYIVVPNFDLRWNAYSWPPQTKDFEAQLANNRKLLQQFNSFKIRSEKHFTVISR